LKKIDCKRYCKKSEGKIRSCDIPSELMDEMVSTVQDGRLIVYPTDTIYCIGASISDEKSLKKVFLAKKRPFDMPVAVCVSDMEMASTVAYLTPVVKKLIQQFMPGPLIVLAERREGVSDLLTAGSRTVGFRIPDHAFALQLIRKCGPITSASANLHSNASPVTVQQSMRELGENVDLYIDCGRTFYRKQSTIVDTTVEGCPVVRRGPIPEEEIRAFIEKT